MSRLPPLDADMAVLLDQLEPPPLSADFADRVLAAAEALPASAPPPLPRLRKAGWRRRVALAFGVGSLVSVAAAAAIAPDALREIPVIGALVEWVSPAEEQDPPAEDGEPEAANVEAQAPVPLLTVPDSTVSALEAPPAVEAEAIEVPKVRMVLPIQEPAATGATPENEPRDMRLREVVPRQDLQRLPQRPEARPTPDEVSAKLAPTASRADPGVVVQTREDALRILEAPDRAEPAPIRERTNLRAAPADVATPRPVPRDTRAAPAVRPERVRTAPRADPGPRTPPRRPTRIRTPVR